MPKPHWKRRAILALCAPLFVTSCEDAEGSDECVDNLQFFRDQIWAPTMSTKCIACHTDTGAGKDSRFVLVTEGWGPGYLEKNMEVVEELAKTTYEGQSWLLLKPTMGAALSESSRETFEHGGLLQVEPGSVEAQALDEMVRRFEDPVVCEDDGDAQSEFFEGVELMDAVATLRKASLSLVGRLPTEAENQRVRDGGFEALDGVLGDMMMEEAFHDRVVEIFNDHFLTDRYIDRTDAIDLLDAEDYPDLYWFDDLPDGERGLAEDAANEGVAREALELVAHIVQNDRPLTEIVTADYTVVNPYSARVYGVDPPFEDPTDPNEFVEVRIPGIPHAGVLSSHIFLNRFPTTATNRNRHRARMVYDFFLATDILRLAERPIDPNGIVEVNPTMFDPNCAVCHENIDPVAGTMQDWDDQGRFRPLPEGWYGDMRQAGFGDAVMPSDVDGATWLGEQLVEDRRFPVAMIQIVYSGLSGQEPLRQPSDPNAADFAHASRAFDVQQEIFAGISERFIEDDYNLKTLVKEVVKTPYYRAVNAVELDEDRVLELAEIGTGRLLTPEQLDRKIEAVTGFKWRRNVNADDYLLDFDEYRIFYGGIDSDTVVERITEPNGIMANVADRMANEVACWTTAQDFLRQPTERMLFPYVEPNYEPEDDNGFQVPAAADAIRANIRYLHQHLFGEFLAENDPRVNQTYDLFLSVWRDGKQGLVSGDYENGLPGQCRVTDDYFTGEPLADEVRISDDPEYTIRAWMAVMTYLLSDYMFLHE